MPYCCLDDSAERLELMYLLPEFSEFDLELIITE